MDTFECYGQNRWDITTINKAAATVLRQAQYFVTALHQPARAVGLSYHGSHIIHSRISNADIQDF